MHIVTVKVNGKPGGGGGYFVSRCAQTLPAAAWE